MNDRKKIIAIVGDGGASEKSQLYQMAFDLGVEFVRHKYRLLTGGRGGVMEAASRKARESDGWTPGDIIAMLPGASPDGTNAWADIVIPTGLGDLRNGLVARSHAVIRVGGGAGTLSEMALAWKIDRLVVAMRTTSGWSARLVDQPLDGRERYPEMDASLGQIRPRRRSIS